MFWRKSSIEKMIERYLERVDECIETFLKAIRMYVTEGRTVQFESLVDECHRTESSADDLRRDIEMTLYGRALLPESRGDILRLLESFDKVPNAAESVLFDISCQRIDMPPELAADILRLAEISFETYGLVRKSFDALMNNPNTTLYTVKEVEDSESKSDRAERALIGRIYDTEYSFGRKNLLRDVVRRLGVIANRCENTADRIGIVAVKRKV